MKVRKKSVIVDAVQITEEWFDGEHPNSLYLVATPNSLATVNPRKRCVEIETREGVMVGNVGDWIVIDVNGEMYLCKADIFEKTYEPVEGRIE